MIKRIIALTLIMIISVSFLTGCLWVINNEEHLPLSYAQQKVVKIEIYDVNQLGENSGLSVFGHADENLSIENLDNLLDPIKTLEGDVAFEFYDNVAHMPFSVTFVFVLAAYDPSHGFFNYVAKITYENGEYDIISEGKQYFSSRSENERITILECLVDWNSFVEEYLD